MAKDQLNIQLPESLQEQFVRDAKRYGFNSKAAVAIDIIAEFYPAWQQLQADVQAFKSARKAELLTQRQGESVRRRTGTK